MTYYPKMSMKNIYRLETNLRLMKLLECHDDFAKTASYLVSLITPSHDEAMKQTTYASSLGAILYAYLKNYSDLDHLLSLRTNRRKQKTKMTANSMRRELNSAYPRSNLQMVEASLGKTEALLNQKTHILLTKRKHLVEAFAEISHIVGRPDLKPRYWMHVSRKLRK